MTEIKRSVQVSDPDTEPLTLSQAKKHLEIAVSDNTHDVHVSALITAAREMFEHDTQIITSEREVQEKLSQWPDDCWRLYHRPIIQVDAIEYFAIDGTESSLNDSQYSADLPNRIIHRAVGSNWPSLAQRWDAVTIEYIAGYAEVPEIFKSAIKLKLDCLFELRGETTKMPASEKAYEMLVKRYHRSSYP